MLRPFCTFSARNPRENSPCPRGITANILPSQTSPFGSVFHSFLFSGEKRELTEIQTGEPEIYIFEWAFLSSRSSPGTALSSSTPPAATLTPPFPDPPPLEKLGGLGSGYLGPWAVKRSGGEQGKQSERHEKAVPRRPPLARRAHQKRPEREPQPGHRAVWLPKPAGQTIGPERMAASFLPVECSAWVSKFNSTSLRSNTRLSRTGENQQRAILGHFQLHLSQGTELWSHPAWGGEPRTQRSRVCAQRTQHPPYSFQC